MERASDWLWPIAEDSTFLSSAKDRWLAWLRWLDQHPPAEPTAAAALAALLQYVEMQQTLTDDKPRDWTRTALNLLGVDFRKSNEGPGHGLFYVSPVQEFSGLWYRPTTTVRDGPYQWRRQTAAHELGHVVLCSLLSNPRLAEGFRKQFPDQENEERFCNCFERLVVGKGRPKEPPFDLWEIVEERMSAKQRQGTRLDAQQVREVTQVGITIQHLYVVAGMYRSSIRSTISWLHRSEALNVALCGIGVFRVAVHPRPRDTKDNDPALRLWQIALPPWGFLPLYRRACMSGFRMASEAFDNVENRKTWWAEEQLKVAENCEVLNIPSRNRFRWRSLQTEVAYVPIDVTNEGRYLIAIWDWNVDDV